MVERLYVLIKIEKRKLVLDMKRIIKMGRLIIIKTEKCSGGVRLSHGNMTRVHREIEREKRERERERERERWREKWK